MEGAVPRAVPVEETLVFWLRKSSFADARLTPPDYCSSDFLKPVTTRELYDEKYTVLRERLAKTKSELDSVDPTVYRHVRDELFPLMKGGGDRTKFHNRAGFKLCEVMESVLMWRYIINAFIPKAARTNSNRQNLQNATPQPSEDKKVAPQKKGKKYRKAIAFLDICGGPGAFSQELYHCSPKCAILRGFGMTLLDSHRDAPQGWYPDLRSKHHFNITFGIDGTGNVYNYANIAALETVLEPERLALVVGDGGFEVASAQANIQEAISLRILFSQWFAAVKVLKPNGCFVLKLFDTFTPFLRSLLFLSLHFFDKVAVVKPRHSRIVNSERYLACLGLRERPSPAWLTLLELVYKKTFSDLLSPVSLVDIREIEKDTEFVRCVDEMIDSIVCKQIEALRYVLDSPLLAKRLVNDVQQASSPPAAEEEKSRKREREQSQEGESDHEKECV